MSLRRVTMAQMDALWEFLNTNREIALGVNKSLQGREHSKRAWMTIANKLNAQSNAANKDWKGWSKYWVDYKSKIKKRCAEVRQCSNRTGGGPATEPELSELEKKFLGILGPDFGMGLEGVRVEPFPNAEDQYTSSSIQNEPVSSPTLLTVIEVREESPAEEIWQPAPIAPERPLPLYQGRRRRRQRSAVIEGSSLSQTRNVIMETSMARAADTRRIADSLETIANLLGILVERYSAAPATNGL